MDFKPRKPGLHMLIADDDYESYYHHFQNEFRGKAYISAVDSGDIAVKLFEEHDYDIVVLDYEMPHDGLEAGKKIRKRSGSAILVGYSSRWNDENAEKAGLDFFSDDENEVIDYLHQTLESGLSQ